jgi:hypothetical protein
VRENVLKMISGSLEEYDHDEENSKHEAETRQLMDELIAMPATELFVITTK